jgi:hypothetical protein
VAFGFKADSAMVSHFACTVCLRNSAPDLNKKNKVAHARLMFELMACSSDCDCAQLSSWNIIGGAATCYKPFCRVVVSDHLGVVVCLARELTAASKGPREHVKPAIAGGGLWDERTTAAAARGNHFGQLRWLREQRCPCNNGVCEGAAHAGNLEMKRWAQANGCDWDHDVCSVAARWGHFELLRWAFENGCALHSKKTSFYAARIGHADILLWLKELEPSNPLARPHASWPERPAAASFAA